MLQQTLQYIHTHQLIKPGSTTLAAVSGGIDSMTLCHLFLQSGLPFAMAHCNFGLRGIESDGDEQLVYQFAKQHHIPLFIKNIDAQHYAKTNGISIQMAARELRYQWFDMLLNEHGFGAIAIAHNSNDNAETFFINLARGTGIKGLCGIKSKHNHIIRPLLFAPREQIEAYAKSENIPFRNDSSNELVKYTRNRIRHKVMPEFEAINPSFLSTMQQNMEHLQSAAAILQNELKKIKENLIPKTNNDILKINISQLACLNHAGFWLFELLHPYGFNKKQTDDIMRSIYGESGKQFFSPTHTMVKDREYLILQKAHASDTNEYYIFSDSHQLSIPLLLHFETCECPNGFIPDKNPQIAQLDFDKLQFPLLLRTWKPGDSFVPLGMKSYKKLSNYFIDKKVSLPEKDKQWLLISGSNIVWIVGQRIDERYKITAQTRRLFICRLGETIWDSLPYGLK